MEVRAGGRVAAPRPAAVKAEATAARVVTVTMAAARNAVAVAARMVAARAAEAKAGKTAEVKAAEARAEAVAMLEVVTIMSRVEAEGWGWRGQRCRRQRRGQRQPGWRRG